MRGLVCIIDDDEDVREVMAYTLEAEGYEVVVFASAVDALEAFKQKKNFKPSLILVDYLMPDMDGIQFTREFRNSFKARASETPIAICSATDSFEGLNELPRDILKLCKPMELDDLLELVEKFARGSSFPHPDRSAPGP